MTAEDFEDWTLEELRTWRKELQRILFAGVFSTSTIGGVFMQFTNTAEIERRLATINAAIALKQGRRPAAPIQVLTIRTRRNG